MSTTPMLQQFQTLKQQNPGTILFFRVGDFYETFYEDAEVASKELGIVLTGRDAGASGRAPMAGVPHHSVHTYIARLVQRGYRVAICEQMEDPKTTKGLLKREVVRIITPGTITDDRMLDEKSNNFVACLVGMENYGLAAADISTGEFFVAEFDKESGPNALDELRKIGSAECLLAGEIPASLELACRQSGLVPDVTLVVPHANDAYRTLTRHFGVSSLHGFGCEGMQSAICAAAVLLGYIDDTQRGATDQIKSIHTKVIGTTLAIDLDTQRNLEILQRISDGSVQGSLLGVLDRTLTAMGARALRRLLGAPFVEANQIMKRLDAVEHFSKDTLLRHEMRGVLDRIKDIERLAARVASENASARELRGLGNSLGFLPEIRGLLSNTDDALLAGLRDALPDLKWAVSLIEKALVDDPPAGISEGGLIRAGYEPRVDELRYAATSGKEWIARLEQAERTRTGIKTLKIGYNRVFGYYIEITHANREMVPEDYVRKQTLVNAERYITPELKEYEDRILHAEERLAVLENDLFCALRSEVAKACYDIQTAAKIVADIDILTCFAEISVTNGYTKPEIEDSGVLQLVDCRHPVVEQILSHGNYVSNDAYMDSDGERLIVITGPNMSGKSTYARSIALCLIMAQTGCFVPAKSAIIGVADRVFARVGASDDVSLGRSTFMVEMTEVANILNNASARSLVILDEVGRGTGTYDGMSLAWAIAEDLNRRVRARSILTTHYHQLVELEQSLPGTVNYRVLVREHGDHVVFLHKIVRGGTDKSYGIHVARLAGVPEAVYERASQVLAEIEAEASARATRRRSSDGEKREREAFQLALLLPENATVVMDRLKALDANHMTPLQALGLLEELIAIAKSD